jgi:heterotetrameric sarcosine oxidase delta subunit
MRIPCPFCGARDLAEFSVLGSAEPERPAIAADALDGEAARAAFADYVYLRDNPKGPHREYWFHAAGCRSWLVVTRDTATHAVLDVVFAAETAP